jgi:hypothetical protein
MVILIKSLSKFNQLSWRDKILILEGTVWLGIVRLTIKVLPFRWMVYFMGQPQKISPDTEEAAYKRSLNRIAWTIKIVSKHLPWDCTCLTQAITAQQMLRYRGLSSTIYLGVAHTEDKSFTAHAWLRSGNTIVTGNIGKELYTTIVTFAVLPSLIFICSDAVPYILYRWS